MRALIQVKFMTQGELAALLNDMSLEEKINQLNQLSGDFFTCLLYTSDAADD